MSYPVLAPGTQPCVWMCAGVIRYRICDRNLDCEHCLLDAALREDSPSRPGHRAPRPSGLERALPRDRLYAPGHIWLKETDVANVWRLGIDAFAAALLTHPTKLEWAAPPGPLHQGDPLCEIDLERGGITLKAPVSGQWLRGNEDLRDDLDLLLSRPYEDGWIGEMAVDPPDLGELCSAVAACSRLCRELERFRRAVALRLLRDGDGVDLGTPGTRGRLTDLGQVLGPDRYVALLRDFVH